MTLNENQIKYMIEGTTKDLVLYLMTDFKMEMADALSAVFESETYAMLSNPSTGLYAQSPVYVYDYLQKEIKTGKLS